MAWPGLHPPGASDPSQVGTANGSCWFVMTGLLSVKMPVQGSSVKTGGAWTGAGGRSSSRRAWCSSGRPP